MRKNTRTIENIGTVSIKDMELVDSNISLYIPVSKMSDEIKVQFEKRREMFLTAYAKAHPDVDTSTFTLNYDISLGMELNSSSYLDGQKKEVTYNISIIMWFKEVENTKDEYVEFCDPFEIDINTEDSRYIKKLVMNKLLDIFF